MYLCIGKSSRRALTEWQVRRRVPSGGCHVLSHRINKSDIHIHRIQNTVELKSDSLKYRYRDVKERKQIKVFGSFSC